MLKGISIVDTPGILSGEKQRTGGIRGWAGVYITCPEIYNPCRVYISGAEVYTPGRVLVLMMCSCEVLCHLVSQRISSTDLLQRVGVFLGSKVHFAPSWTPCVLSNVCHSQIVDEKTFCILPFKANFVHISIFLLLSCYHVSVLYMKTIAGWIMLNEQKWCILYSV